jgi:hypothetical protein
MRLVEFTDQFGMPVAEPKSQPAADDALAIAITAIVSQLHSRLRDTGTKHPYSLKALLAKLSDSDIHITAEQFRDMIKSEPLSNLVTNVKGGNVIFRGEPDDQIDAIEPEASTKTLKSMAKKAQKNRD